MARVKLEEQPQYEFTYTFAVQARDLSSRRHLGSDAIVALMHEAVVAMLGTLGLSELDLGDGRTGVMQAETAVNFIRESFIFEEITVESRVGSVDADSFRVFHRMRRSGETIALAESVMFAFDFNLRAPSSLPDSFKRALMP